MPKILFGIYEKGGGLLYVQALMASACHSLPAEGVHGQDSRYQVTE